MAVVEQVHARLIADDDFVDMLDQYHGVPAVIVADEHTVPGDVPPRYAVVLGADQDEPNDCKVESGREVLVAVRIYFPATGDTAPVQAAAERARDLLHRQPAGLAPGAYIALCSGPTVAPTDTSLYGRQVTLRLTSLAT